jgi:outer membrane protein, heavy metal efflux system
MKKVSVILTLLLFPVLLSHGQDTTAVSLSQLLESVEKNYPTVIQYQYNIQSIQARLEGAKAWMPPTASFGLERFPYQLSNIRMKDDPMNEAGLVFSIEQMIPNPGKLNAKKNYINSLSEIEKSRAEWTKNELKRDAKLLYYSRFINEKKQAIVQENEEVLKLLLTTAEEKFSTNQSQLQTIYKARARLAEIENMQLMLQQMIAESNIGLNILLIRDANAVFTIDTIIALQNYKETFADTSSIPTRSDIAAMSKSIESMQLEQKLMRSGRLADFGIRAEHMQMFGMPNQWSVMGMMTLPVLPWSNKMYRSETKSLGYQVQAMEQQRLSMELMAKRMLAEKLTMLKYEERQYENYNDEIIPAFENNMQANMLAYRQNTGDFFVLLDAWEMLLMKKMEMNDKLYNILKLETEYEYEKEKR